MATGPRHHGAEGSCSADRARALAIEPRLRGDISIRFTGGSAAPPLDAKDSFPIKSIAVTREIECDFKTRAASAPPSPSLGIKPSEFLGKQGISWKLVTKLNQQLSRVGKILLTDVGAGQPDACVRS
jgi:hypothetical protein